VLIKGKIFGSTKGYCYPVEFQKRGLPHADILLILKDQYKFRTEQEIDQFISAEIPDEIASPELFERVKTHIFHGHYGSGDRDYRGYRDG
jgi:hypothetical protein